MARKNLRYEKTLRRLAVGLAALAVAVPAAPALAYIPADPDPVAQSAPVVHTVYVAGTPETKGFDWSDAAVGIGIGLGAGLLLAGGSLLAVRRRGPLARA